MASLGKGGAYRTEPDLKNEGEAVSESTTSTTTSTSSMGTYKASNGTTLSASNCTLSFMLQEALNHSIANFAY